MKDDKCSASQVRERRKRSEEDNRTLIVCTVLTGMREIAMLEKICPPTWNTPISDVLFSTSLVGLRSLVKRITGLERSKQ